MSRVRRAFSLLEIVVVLGVILLLAALVLAVSGSVLAASERRETENVMRLLEQATLEWEQALGRPINYGPKVEPILSPPAQPEPATRDVYEENFGGSWMSCVLMQRFGENERTRDIVSKIPETYSRRWRTGDPALPGVWGNISAVATNPNRMPNGNGNVPLVLDAWGFRIGVCFPGRPWRNGTGLSTTNTGQFYSGGLYLRGVNSPASGAPDADGTEQTPDERIFGSCRDRRIRFVSAGPDGAFGDVYGAEGSAAKKQTQDNIVSYE
jgi:type II secretory pathway pseudopilin PulG